MHAAGLVATAVLQHAAQRRSAVVHTYSCIYMCVCPIVFWLQVADPISLSENIVKYIYIYIYERAACSMHAPTRDYHSRSLLYQTRMFKTYFYVRSQFELLATSGAHSCTGIHLFTWHHACELREMRAAQDMFAGFRPLHLQPITLINFRRAITAVLRRLG